MPTPCAAHQVVYGKPQYAFMVRSRYLDSGYELVSKEPFVLLCIPEARSSLIQFFGTVIVASSPLHILISTPDEYLTPDHSFYLFFFPLHVHSSVPVTLL